ncbi:50S ribosomal protein L28 [Salibacteraceae bacterium]|jgi:large subunit ribosomal protein L28|nr:50S ribosomal protein L28 [Salibacteraceae bacterium]MDB0002325.1 50S ribosomal protein L28 [Salibacteraceae bacterium]MDB4105458.1 50S ribosomal protein L28 [Salibacteraceae bacterium]MDB9708558.1 50S ribosomal protein L28 [Salibacteraceae bacterium]HAQ72318.1 50S ribosomal protein L28 [Flavobacteriales bacterium]
MKICQITGKTAQSGHHVSHSNHKTNRKFNVNLHTKKFFDVETKEWVTLKVSSAGIRNISKNGLAACMKEAKANGFL